MPFANNNQQAGKLPEAVTNSVEYVSEGISNIGSSIGERIDSATTYMKESVAGFGSPDRTTSFDQFQRSFFESNTIVAKFAFLLFVLILFMFLLNLGIKLIGYFTAPSSSPYLIRGTMNASNEVVISQDPKNKNSISILRSNNRNNGIEFTWVLWLYINDFKYDDVPTNKHIFNKGNGDYDAETGIATVNNGPGVYFDTSNDPKGQKLAIAMNTVAKEDPTETVYVYDVPLRKWFHCAIRMENKVMDVYINGVIVKRQVLQNVPKQNYQDVNICKNGGFNGNLADLKYYDRALSVFEINSIVAWGRNTFTATANGAITSDATGFPYYLSNLWYSRE